MKKIINFTLNTIFFMAVIGIAFSVSTIALTRKVNESKVYINNLQGSVVKQKVVVLTLTRGIIDQIHVKSGQTVKKGDILIAMSNPVLESNYRVYQQRVNNESAQTEASIARVSLENLIIKSPVNGIVGDIQIAEGSSVDEFSKVMLIYASADIRLQAELTAAQYQKAQKFTKVTAYSSRLNRNYVIDPGLLKADEKTPTDANEKKIGLYFNFKDNAQAAALIHNENLSINLGDNTITRKPVDIFTDFWNGLLSKKS